MKKNLLSSLVKAALSECGSPESNPPKSSLPETKKKCHKKEQWQKTRINDKPLRINPKKKENNNYFWNEKILKFDEKYHSQVEFK